MRFTLDQEVTIEELSKELKQTFNETVRDLIAIALTIQERAEKITLKDILFSISDKLAESPYTLAWGAEFAEKKERKKLRSKSR